jgi:excisionase family DNA binding protein
MSEPNPFAPFFDEVRRIVKEEIAAAVKGSKDDKLLTVAEVCQVLNVTEPWIYHNVKKLPFTRKVGGMLRFSNNDLQRWIQAQRFQDAKLKKLGS